MVKRKGITFTIEKAVAFMDRLVEVTEGKCGECRRRPMSGDGKR